MAVKQQALCIFAISMNRQLYEFFTKDHRRIEALVASAMKHFVTILLILLGHLSYGQKTSDTCLTERQFHDLKYRISYLVDKNITQQFQIRFLTDLNRIDTVHKSADSLVIKYFDKTEKLIRTQKKRLKNNCTKDSLLIHYNKDELEEYIENWSSSLCDADTTDKENMYFIYKNSYSRYEYDSSKRVTKYVFHISTPMTRRVLISYDREGKKSIKTIAIRDEEFWD